LKDIKNTYYSAIEAVTIPIMMLLATPIFINSLGIELFGVWMLINSIIIALSIVNIGGVDTIIRYIAYYRGKGDTLSIGRMFSSIFVLQISLLLFLSIFLFVMVAYFEMGSVIGLQKQQLPIFISSLQFGILLFSLKIIEQTILAYFKGYERYDIASKFSVSSKIAMIGVQILTVIYTESLVEVFKNSFITILLMITIQVLFLKYYYHVKFLVLFSVESIRKVLNFTGWTWLLSIIGVISSQFDRWIISALANMATLGLYSLAILVFSNIHAIIISSVAWIFPKVSHDEDNKTTTQYYIVLQALLIFGGVLVSYILIRSEYIFNMWLGSETFENSIDYIQNILIVIPFYAIGIVPFYIIQGNGLAKKNTYTHFFDLLVRICFMSVLYNYYGVNGVILALGISGFILFLNYMRTIRKHELLANFNAINLKCFIMLPFLYLLFMFTDQRIIEALSVVVFVYLYYQMFFKKIKAILIK
jgi:O-antigen/teichoic acid export membrane protein